MVYITTLYYRNNNITFKCFNINFLKLCIYQLHCDGDERPNQHYLWYQETKMCKPVHLSGSVYPEDHLVKHEENINDYVKLCKRWLLVEGQTKVKIHANSKSHLY